MSDEDIASFSNRMAPRGAGVVDVPSQKIAFVVGANAAVALRAVAQAPRYISIKVVGTGAACQVITGPNVPALANTAGDPLFEPVDSWQDIVLANGATHIKLFGVGADGDLYVWDRGM